MLFISQFKEQFWSKSKIYIAGLCVSSNILFSVQEAKDSCSQESSYLWASRASSFCGERGSACTRPWEEQSSREGPA